MNNSFADFDKKWDDYAREEARRSECFDEELSQDEFDFICKVSRAGCSALSLDSGYCEGVLTKLELMR